MIKESQFQKELLELSQQAGQICGCDPSRFLKTLETKGAVQTAKESIRRNRVSDLFNALHKAGHLELSMEALVVEEKYADLFTDDEVNYCFGLLCECGYY